jgi:hypothetical protein
MKLCEFLEALARVIALIPLNKVSLGSGDGEELEDEDSDSDDEKVSTRSRTKSKDDSSAEGGKIATGATPLDHHAKLMKRMSFAQNKSEFLTKKISFKMTKSNVENQIRRDR